MNARAITQFCCRIKATTKDITGAIYTGRLVRPWRKECLEEATTPHFVKPQAPFSDAPSPPPPIAYALRTSCAFIGLSAHLLLSTTVYQPCRAVAIC